MESASQRGNHAMASVKRDTLTALIVLNVAMAVSVAIQSIIMSAMELAPPSLEPAMESVLREELNATDDATLNRLLTRIFMSVTEHAPGNLTPAMESALMDMFHAPYFNIATLKIHLRSTSGTAGDNALASLNHATGSALRKEQSAETTGASAVMISLAV